MRKGHAPRLDMVGRNAYVLALPDREPHILMGGVMAVSMAPGTTVVGFVGVRIMNVKLVGANKRLIIQPGVVVDDSAITESCPNATCGTLVFQPVRLTR